MAVFSSEETKENNFIYIFFNTERVLTAPKFWAPILETPIIN